jgi:hypothetical protein
MGLDFATGAGVLALYGANLLDVPFFEFSIGGPPGGTLGGILGLWRYYRCLERTLISPRRAHRPFRHTQPVRKRLVANEV